MGIIRFLNLMVYVLPFVLVRFVLSRIQTSSVEKLTVGLYLVLFLVPVGYVSFNKVRHASSTHKVEDGISIWMMKHCDHVKTNESLGYFRNILLPTFDDSSVSYWLAHMHPLLYKTIESSCHMACTWGGYLHIALAMIDVWYTVRVDGHSIISLSSLALSSNGCSMFSMWSPQVILRHFLVSGVPSEAFILNAVYYISPILLSLPYDSTLSSSGVLTSSSVSKLSDYPPYLKFEVYFWCSVASSFACGWILVLNSSLRGKLLYRFQKSEFIWFFLHNISSPMYVTIITILFMGLSCDYSRHPPTLFQDESIVCYGSKHTAMAQAGLIALSIYLIQHTLLPSGKRKVMPLPWFMKL